MPIRIYALAKELKLDSKALVDVVSKAGVTGKGSALASLTDDELAKVKAYLDGGKSSATATKTGVSPSAAPHTVSGDQPFTRDQYIGPGGSTGKLRALGETPKKDESDGEEASKKPASDASKLAAKKDPVIKLAAIPQSEQPEPTASADEPTPQKPIMTLPADAIRSAKDGQSSPLGEFTKQQDRKRGKGSDSSVPPTARPATPKPPEDAAARGRAGRGTRRVKAEVDKEEKKGLAGMASARVARQQNRKRRPGGQEDSGPGRRRRTRLTRKGTNTAAPRKGNVVVQLPCTIRSFSEATGIPSTDILRSLMAVGSMVSSINAELDDEYAEMIAEEAGIEIDFKHEESLEDSLMTSIEEYADSDEDLVPRPPIVTFLGHVDHGKTSLLDYLIGIDVVSGEAGGITQHIRAYKVTKDGKTISFVDTPGHEAFTAMRARGANVTDIAVLVVAADDGVMPQTEEAISHAKAAEVPIVVALNKIDLPSADVNKAYQDLSTHDLLPSEWGGEVEVIKTSAITGEGMDDLLETLALTAEIHEYKANPNRKAIGTCLEAQQEGARGVVLKVVVQNGTLRVGDVVVCGGAHGRVKAMYDTLRTNDAIDEAGPSTPVNLLGLDIVPDAGEPFYVLDDIGVARDIAEQREDRSRTRSLSGQSTRVSFDEFQRRLEEGVLGGDEGVSTLNLIIRADVRGSLEAIEKELNKLAHPEVEIKLLQTSVGGISVADVTLADASDAVILGFNVIPDELARAMADERGVEIRRYDIIYKITEEIRSLLEGKLRPEERVTELGRALVQQTFTISRLGTVAGCRVLAGTIERGCRIRINRDARGIGDYPLDSLKREKDDAKEVREGYECGIKLSGFNDLKEGDVLEAYKIVEVARTLDS